MANTEATLEWPRFCYSGSPIPDETTNFTRPNVTGENLVLPLVKKKTSTPMNGVGRKRKATTNKTSSIAVKYSPKIRKTDSSKHLDNKEDQTVPSINRFASGVGAVADLFNLRQGNTPTSCGIFPSSSITPPPHPIPEFAFSNMMRKMASKYIQSDSSESLEKKSSDHPYGHFKQGSHAISNSRSNGIFANNLGLDATLAVAALGQYLPLALQNGNLNTVSRPNHSETSYSQAHPFSPFMKHLSSITPNSKPHEAFSAFLASTSAIGINKLTDLNVSRKEIHSEQNNENRNNRLQDGSEISRPMDLSSSNTIYGGSTGNISNLDTSRSDINEDEDDENVDVLSIDPPASPSDIEQWSVDTVVEFISNVESCQDYQDVFREHSIDGSALVVLSETHMTRILGMKLGPAFRLRAAITDLMNRTTSPSFCITN